MALNRKRALAATFVIAGLVVVMTGGLMASNMGFKLNRSLVAAGGSSISGTNSLGLPFNRQVGIDNAAQLFADIGFFDTQNVQKFLPENDTYQLYSAVPQDGQGNFANNFNLSTGEGYFAKVSSDVPYIVVGSHDPSAVIQLTAAGGGSLSGTNFYAPPYHSTADSASALFGEIGFFDVTNIQKFLPGNDTYQLYSAVPKDGQGNFANDFALTPGEAYFIKVSNSVAYSPSHY